MASPQSKEDLSVLIVGAGLGGLMTAILLERAGIAYHLFERAATVKPIGAVLTLNANITPVFKQLGLLDDLLKFSNPIKQVFVYNRAMQQVGLFDQSQYLDRTGYDALALARPELYDLLLSQIPKEKISFNKKVISIQQDLTKAMILCEDGSNHEASIIIGADGAYSRVRTSLFEDLSSKGILPEVDTKEMVINSVSLFAVTDELDPEEFEDLKGETAKFVTMTGGGDNWGYVSLTGNRFSWVTTHKADAAMLAQKNNKALWGAVQSDALIEQVGELPLPLGGTLARLIAQTPKERISRVLLEEKLFETWYHGRVVLLGDACHKMTPGAGQGAINAMQDAVVLVNCLNSIDHLSPETVTEAFEDYRQLRYEPAKRQMEKSRQMQSFIFCKTRFQEMIRWLILTLVPGRVLAEANIAEATYQPQASFLPLAVGNPEFKVELQQPLKRYGASGQDDALP